MRRPVDLLHSRRQQSVSTVEYFFEFKHHDNSEEVPVRCAPVLLTWDVAIPSQEFQRCRESDRSSPRLVRSQVLLVLARSQTSSLVQVDVCLHLDGDGAATHTLLTPTSVSRANIEFGVPNASSSSVEDVIHFSGNSVNACEYPVARHPLFAFTLEWGVSLVFAKLP